MKSPIHFVGFLDTSIDLSKLLEVKNAFVTSEGLMAGHEGTHPCVAFTYRLEGDKRHRTFWRRMNTTGRLVVDDDAYFRRKEELVEDELVEKWDHRRDENRYTILMDPRDSSVPLALTRLQTQVNELIRAWQAWKAVEPEIYAIIRKHLS